jgi:hypothetical protein
VTPAQLAAGFGIGIATVFRYIREAVESLAALSPTLAEAMRTIREKAFVILDGTLLPIDRIAADTPYYSGKHKRHGMNVLPREARIIGALIRLYAVPVSRIVELTTDRFHRDENGAYLTLDRHPVLLPPKLALLIEEQIVQPVTDSRMRQQFGNGNGYLFPGKAPGRSRNVVGTHNLLNQVGLPVLSARNTAMIEAVTSLPPIVVADLFGMHPSTAQRWANYAKDDWSVHLSARMNST